MLRNFQPETTGRGHRDAASRAPHGAANGALGAPPGRNAPPGAGGLPPHGAMLLAPPGGGLTIARDLSLRPPPGLNMEKSIPRYRLCEGFQAGRCRHAVCRFPHGDDELRYWCVDNLSQLDPVNHS